MEIILLEDKECNGEILLNLLELGFSNIYKFNSITEIKRYLEKNLIDLLIFEFNSESQDKIFELDSYLKDIGIPCILISKYPNYEVFDKLMAYPNIRYIVKPFHVLTLKCIIQSLNIFKNKDLNENGLKITGRLRKKIVIPYDKILWLEAKGNYTTIVTVNNKKHSIKKALKQLSINLDERFLKIQRALFINTNFLRRVDLNNEIIVIEGNVLKIGRKYRSDLINHMNKKYYT